MNYRIKLIERQWFITEDEFELHGPYASGTEAREALRKLRNGHTATTVATISRKQESRRQAREATGK